MSYCRWSSDHWRCDVYCYANVSGAWTTHVAARRIVGEVPHESAWADFLAEKITPADFARMYGEQMRFLKTATMVLIGLPFDGESFDDEGPMGMHARLTELKAIGYNVPEHVFAELLAEAKTEPEQ
jgi:hypothetical protein